MNDSKNIVVIGGGTGTFVVLSGLKKYFSCLTAIVSMADSGGSNSRIRDEFGLLPTSDIRQCFVALAAGGSQAEKLMRQLFIYRFTKGNGVAGMSFGNLFMAALADILGSQGEAIKKTGEVLRIRGRVIPVTMDKVDLVAHYENGVIVKGEHFIDEPHSGHNGRLKIIKLESEPKCLATKEACRAIGQADLIILGPGDLYTSILANLVVGGIAQAIKKSKAKCVYIVNLMTKWGQTYNFSAADHVKEVEKYIGKKIDHVLVNSSSIPAKVIEYYSQKEQSMPVDDDLGTGIRVIRAELLSKKIHRPQPEDTLKRSLIRHDSSLIAKKLKALLQ